MDNNQNYQTCFYGELITDYENLLFVLFGYDLHCFGRQSLALQSLILEDIFPSRDCDHLYHNILSIGGLLKYC